MLARLQGFWLSWVLVKKLFVKVREPQLCVHSRVFGPLWLLPFQPEGCSWMIPWASLPLESKVYHSCTTTACKYQGVPAITIVILLTPLHPIHCYSLYTIYTPSANSICTSRYGLPGSTSTGIWLIHLFMACPVHHIQPNSIFPCCSLVYS